MTDDAPTPQTLHQLARTTGLSASWLKEEAVAGRIPSLRAGRRLLFNEGAVLSALLRRAGEAPPPPAPGAAR